MKLPKSWLCEYVDFNVSDADFAERMMWRGFELEGTEKELAGVAGVVTGRIVSLAPHPNADKLLVCQVDIGDKTVQILTNATNVFESACVPVAIEGAKIREKTFGAANIRGVDSFGMFCSGEELALTEDECPGAGVDGILILPPDTQPGLDIAAALGKDDIIFDFSVTPNRPDCLSILGLAREAAAALGQAFQAPEIPHIADDQNAADLARVTVEEPKLCPRYCARVVTDIRVGPSPAWMQRRLRACGLRPINNIVDITNYVLLEMGHPLHAFDLACVAEGHIIVRRAAEGEIVTTLDEKQHKMDADMLLIADPKKGVAIAGVMGGLNSEIVPETKTVLFESAVFLGSNVRKTAKKLRHVTDAAARFAKGVEPVNAYMALERAIALVRELNAGTIYGEVIDANAADLTPRQITIDTDHVNRILGLDLSGAAMAELLSTIDIPAAPAESGLLVTVPHFRGDIESGIEADADIAEEVGRLYGYQNIPPVLMRGETFRGQIGPAFCDEDGVKDCLVRCGCLEMYNFNFTGPAALALLGFHEDDDRNKAVRIQNPFGEDQSLMRTSLYSGMLESAGRNVSRRTGHGRFMEVGNVHIAGGEALPEERKMIGLIYFGEMESFFTLKGTVEQLMRVFRVPNLRFVAKREHGFQPGRCAAVYSGQTLLGEMGQVHPDVLAAYSIAQPVYMAELSFSALRQVKSEAITFVPLPRYPLVARDLAVVVDAGAESAAIADIIAGADTKPVLISDVRLFDAYRGHGVPHGKKSLAFTFNLRASDHTLSEAEIRQAFETIIEALARNGAPLRS
ncbi:MAG: phenylalanine--tRNA ligase subunit beta [Clostridiales bacterium]|nr:phenylalanine--tRNA ligase subunit beta [Clostridiales bacterium]